MNQSELLEVAVEAARAAGALLVERYRAGTAGVITSKSTPTDLVSETDVAAETLIRELLASRVPDDGIRGEEGDDTPGTSGRWWVVDPLDGTINYLYGHPQWCVSVACDGLVGVVFDPLRDELFCATAGGTATLNGTPIGASGADELSQALVATGFGYAAEVRAEQASIVATLLPQARDIRRAGSAALDLAWTACGRVDAYYEHGVQPWDIAAGTILCEAVGLTVTPVAARGVRPAGICVTPPALTEPLLAIVG